jgi:hypothetical protein
MDAHYQATLNKALTWINENFKPIGIIVTGSIIRGNPNTNSDFDIFAIHEETYRQRIQKYFDGIACEIFVNNIAHVHAYFEEEYKSNRPVTAHMVATGKVVSGMDHPEISQLVKAANEFVIKSPELESSRKIAMSYTIATMFEDAEDIKETDQLTSRYFLDKLVIDIIEFIFLHDGIPLPRPKERIKYLADNNPGIGKLVADYYSAESFIERFDAARKLVLITTNQSGFFEWDSGKA